MNISVEAGAVIKDCGGVGNERSLPMPFDEAVSAAIGAALAPSSFERISLWSATGRVLATNTISPVSLPRFDHSAMDGYAVKSSSFFGSGPWTFTVAERLFAGDCGLRGIVPEAVVEIFTGAPVPEGFDAVVIRERCTALGNGTVLVSTKPGAGENIRLRGEDVAVGAEVAQAGQLITPHVAALLAALGIDDVDVRPKVRIALLTTGTELRLPAEPLAPGQIYDSNRFMIAATLSLPWIELTDLGHFADHLKVITDILESAAGDYDVLVTSGGMSHGAADYIRAALSANEARLNVTQVAMRPGKPATIGRVGRALFVGLPGNPMAAAVVLGQIALPAIRKTAGLAKVGARWAEAVSGFEYRKPGGRTEFVPVSIIGRDIAGRPVLEMLGRGSSGSLLPLARADGLARLPEETSLISPGAALHFEAFIPGL